jgi:hypothetical protein
MGLPCREKECWEREETHFQRSEERKCQKPQLNCLWLTAGSQKWKELTALSGSHLNESNTCLSGFISPEEEPLWVTLLFTPLILTHPPNTHTDTYTQPCSGRWNSSLAIIFCIWRSAGSFDRMGGRKKSGLSGVRPSGLALGHPAWMSCLGLSWFSRPLWHWRCRWAFLWQQEFEAAMVHLWHIGACGTRLGSCGGSALRRDRVGVRGAAPFVEWVPSPLTFHFLWPNSVLFPVLLFSLSLPFHGNRSQVWVPISASLQLTFTHHLDEIIP